MRIRSTKPEFWRSERIASVDWDDRLVLKGLESYVDDNGVGKDDLALIVGDLFQRDLVREPSRTLARVSEAISRLNVAGLVWRYEANSTALLYVSFWESIQRVDKPQSGRFPRPDGTMNYKESIIRECVANPREPSRTLAPGTGEQGNRGTGEIIPTAVDLVTTQRENDEPKNGPAESATIGAELVARADLPAGIPAQTIAKLRVNATNLVCAGSAPTHVLAALRTYGTRTGVTPGILADLVADEAKRANGTEHTRAPTAYEAKRARNAAVFNELATPDAAKEITR